MNRIILTILIAALAVPTLKGGDTTEQFRSWSVSVDQPALASAGSIPLASMPAPTSGIGTALVGGYASWFQSPGHTAAAGPLIRAAIPHWRGKLLTVRSGELMTVVRLTDSCQCGDRAGLPTLLDLSPAAFSDLAPLSAGVVAVEIELVATEPLPATDTQ